MISKSPCVTAIQYPTTFDNFTTNSCIYIDYVLQKNHDSLDATYYIKYTDRSNKMEWKISHSVKKTIHKQIKYVINILYMNEDTLNNV